MSLLDLSLPAAIAHELADEAPGHPASTCQGCGALARPLFRQCSRCEVMARTVAGRILLALRSGPRSSRWLCARLGKNKAHILGELQELRRQDLVIFDPSPCQWRAL